jgi:hypothetical protein
MLVKYPYFIEKFNLPGCEALKLLDALKTYFKGNSGLRG